MIIDIDPKKLKESFKEHCKNTECEECDLMVDCIRLFYGNPLNGKNNKIQLVVDSLNRINSKFAENRVCGECANMLLYGATIGFCSKGRNKKHSIYDLCSCGKYKKGKPMM